MMIRDREPRNPLAELRMKKQQEEKEKGKTVNLVSGGRMHYSVRRRD